MRYVSIFSGIEAATVAWEPLGFEPVCFAEFDEFPSAVLQERFPDVPNVGDVTKVDWRKVARKHGKPDLLVGGSPCQSFSIAGTRTGLDGASGLMWEYVRAVRELKPAWVLWENVPGALSSSGGEDFRCLLESLDALGYGLAWRVLDAQFFGLAQRRERLFLVGRLGSCPPVQVLFEPEGLRWCAQSSREKRQELAAGTGRGAACAGFKYSAGSGAQSVGYQEESSNTITADWHAPAVVPFAVNQQRQVRIQGDGTYTGAIPSSRSATQFNGVVQRIAYPINEQIAVRGNKLGRGTGFGIGDDGDPAFTLLANHPHAVASAFAVPNREGCAGGGKGPLVQDDVSGTLATGNDQVLFAPKTYTCETAHTGSNGLGVGESDVAGTLSTSPSEAVASSHNMVVRRLTPRECERLQGFPDDWTRIPYRGKPADECPDGARYKAIGNSMAVPVMRWIGERIALSEAGELE